MSFKLSVDFNDVEQLCDLISDVDSTCSPVVDIREPTTKLKVIQAELAKAHAILEKILGEHTHMVYLPEEQEVPA